MFGPISPTVRQLLLINVIVFLVVNLLGAEARFEISRLFGLVTDNLFKGMVWQLVTYMFLHGGFTHILWNMFGLYIFGSQLEYYWGSRFFLKYYLITGVGAGVIHVIATLFTGGTNIPTVGASGALFGLLGAYGLLFPHQQILLYFLIPIPARVFVIIFGVLELLLALSQPHSGIARFAHLGGLVVGLVYLKKEQLLWKWKRTVGQPRRRPPRDPDVDPEEEARRRDTIDAILEKISREGMGSLSPEERRLLEESARRARQRQQRGE